MLRPAVLNQIRVSHGRGLITLIVPSLSFFFNKTLHVDVQENKTMAVSLAVFSPAALLLGKLKTKCHFWGIIKLLACIVAILCEKYLFKEFICREQLLFFAIRYPKQRIMSLVVRQFFAGNRGFYGCAVRACLSWGTL